MVVVAKIVGATIVGLENGIGVLDSKLVANHIDRDALLIVDEDCASFGVTPRDSNGWISS